MGDLNYGAFLVRLWVEMEKAQVPQIIRNPSERAHYGAFQYQHAPSRIQELAVETFFHLIRNGYAVEKPSDFINQPTADWYRWTERGRRWIESAEPIPEDAEGYVQFLKLRVPKLDPVIEQYVGEAVTAFGRQAHFAAAVMLGAASEKALYTLAGSMVNTVKAPKDKERLQALLDRRRLNDLLAFVRDDIASRAKTMPYTVTEGSTTHLMSIAEAIRVQRNDAVHPMNGVVSEESVRVLLVSFPYALQRIEALRTWFLCNPQSN